MVLIRSLEYTLQDPIRFWRNLYGVGSEHSYIDELSSKIENYDEIIAYREDSARKSEFERTELAKEKTGVQIKGLYAINPCTKKRIPIWVSDYVLISYGTGAVMAVPAHDDRDWEFAQKFNLPVIEVVKGGDIKEAAYTPET